MSETDTTLNVTINGHNNSKAAVEEAKSGFVGLWKSIAAGQLVYSAAQSALNVFTSSIGSAVSRVDTLNNSSKVFANLGFKAAEVKTAMGLLDTSIKGLPTSLDQAVSGMQSLALQNGSILSAQKEFTAMNDAVLSSGGSTAQLSNAIQQITQLDMNGPLDAQTWDSLRQSGMEPAMKAMANMSGVSMAQLKTEFGNGTLKVQDFMNKLQTLDTNGTGNMASLNKQAKDMTGGIGNSMDNAKTAVVRGMANIIQAIGTQNIANIIKTAGKGLEDLANAIAGAFTWVAQHKKDIENFVKELSNIAIAVAPLITAFVIFKGALMIWDAIDKIRVAFEIFRVITIPSLIASLQSLWAVMLANPFILIAAIAAAVAILIVTHWSTVKQWFGDFWDWIKDAANKVYHFLLSPYQDAVSDITSVMKTVWDFLRRVFGDIGDAIHQFRTHAFEDIGFFLGYMLALPLKIIGAFAMLDVKLIELIINMVKSVIKEFSKFVNWLINIDWIGIFKTLVKDYINIWKKLADDTISIFTKVIKWFMDIDWLSIFKRIGQAILTATVDAAKWLYNVGQDMVKGLVHGIEDFIGTAVKQVKKLGSGIVKGFKDALGIHSPSTVFAELGTNMGQGLIQGLQGVKAQANIAVTSLVSGGMARSNAPAPSNVSNSTTNNYTSTGGGTQNVTIGQISLTSQASVQEFFKHINQDTMNSSKGLSLVQGAY